jgi:hypothetical protein
MATTRTRRVGQEAERDKEWDVEHNHLETLLEIGLEETFPASDAVAVIEPAPKEKTDPGGA